MENTSGRNTDKLMEDTFEAFVFAIFLDLGIQITHQFIINVMESVVDFVEINANDINYKHQLLEMFQKLWNLTPNYTKISEIGPPHQKTYLVGATDPLGIILSTGSASMKRDAEQLASLKAITVLSDCINSNDWNSVITNYTVRNLTGIIDSMEELMKPELFNIVSQVIQNVNVFIVSFKCGDKNYNYTIRYTQESYKTLKNMLESEKTINYLRALIDRQII